MTKVIWLPSARVDFERLHSFIHPHSPTAANNAMAQILAAADELAHFPQMGRPLKRNINFRELTVQFGSKGYIIRYRIFEENVYIARVWHALEGRDKTQNTKNE